MTDEMRQQMREALKKCDFVDEQVSDGVHTGYLDTKHLEYFFDQALTAERERIVREIKKLQPLNLPNNDVWDEWDTGYHYAIEDIINLIQSNK